MFMMLYGMFLFNEDHGNSSGTLFSHSTTNAFENLDVFDWLSGDFQNDQFPVDVLHSFLRPVIWV
jgi:hypothetical protein